MTQTQIFVDGSPDLSQGIPSVDNGHEPIFNGYAQEISGYIDDARRRAEIASRFTLEPVLSRYCREEGLSPDIAQAHRRELLRFLALCATATNHGKSYGMTGAVDELWHTFVIFTREYADFCEAVAGRFLHHVPEVEGSMSPSTVSLYLSFLEDYEAVFEEPAPAAYWPRPDGDPESNQCRGCSACSGCGGGGSCTVN
ncbi:glycine-rich domain-containing protein [Agrobacterium cavarae]